MAYTVAIIDKTVLGNKRVHILSCVADAATQTIDTGLSSLDFIQYTPKSMTTAAAKFALNAGATSTSIAGSIGVSGVASGDEFWVTCYGK